MEEREKCWKMRLLVVTMMGTVCIDESTQGEDSVAGGAN